MNLVRAEAQRLLARRFTQVLLVLLVVAFGITLLTIVASTHQPTADEIVRAEQEAAAAQANAEEWYRRCLETNAATGNSSRALERCGSGPRPVSPANFLPGVFVFAEEIRPLLYFLTAFLGLFGFLVGASYVGAELTSGGMTNLLLWQPNRIQVLATKLGVLLAGVLATAVLGAALYIGAFWGLGAVAGLPGDLSAGFWADTGSFLARGVALTLLVTVLGFTVATLGRHTAAALGALAGYVVLWEVGGRIVLYTLEHRGAETWMLFTYAAAWMEKSYVVYASCMLAETSTCRQVVTMWDAAVVFAVLLAAAVTTAFAMFRRRDLA